ncbi:hypothetical protein [Mycobacterium sp. TY815]|uniref:tyrosine-type recombinase/integrase n=1 Tax=Mycobacterium sp. TY815 TaxID=3050581 RepID=UPI0027423B1D|nr:hypothetical protein [Mycobacterium sp. TY815]MDP7707455.1 hypothetical protein [Mycobacterium sp. TY815]
MASIDIHCTPDSFGFYSRAWVEQRQISQRTRQHYRRLLDKIILTSFACMAIGDITPDMVETWYAATELSPQTVRIHAYSLLRAILQDALSRNIIDSNPCHNPDVKTSRRTDAVHPATAEELDAMAAAMPPRYQPLILMAAWLAMPFSELAELRRKDIDLNAGIVRVRRAVALTNGQFHATTPKSTLGIRDIPIPPTLAPRINAHLRHHVRPDDEALLFPSVLDCDRHLSPSVLYPMFHKARAAAGRPDLRVPDLRRSSELLITEVHQPP